ncbi:hypothetical protein Thu_213 [Bacillus phage Thurquoise]|nr:hypothetical protein Thu_213 [Bacillus phage Thurquoise]
MEYVLAVLILMVIGGIALWFMGGYDSEVWSVLLIVIGGVCLFVAGMVTFGNRHDSAQFIAQYEVLEATIQYNRGIGMSELERLELNKKIAEYNETLAKYKYANDGHFFDITVVDEVSKLEYLK